MIKKSKINDIRSILSRLGNIVTKKYIKDVKKELYEIEKKQNLSGNEKKKKKKRFMMALLNQHVSLIKKDEYKHYDHDDLNYFGIRVLENYLMILIMVIIINQYYLKVPLKLL